MSGSESSQHPLSIGEQLKSKREAMGLSLMDVSEVTKVSVRHLAALEQDKFKDLPSEIYAWLFLRTYAKHLGLPADDVKRRFQEMLHPAPAPAVLPSPIPQDPVRSVPVEIAPRPAKTERPSLGGRSQTPLPPVARASRWAWWGVIGVGGLAVVAVVMWQPPSHKGDEKITAGITPTTSSTLAGGSVPVTPPVGATLPRPTNPSPTHEGVLHVKANVHTWIEIMVDGKERFALPMKPGEERIWMGQKGFLMQIGYPPGLELKLNGVRLTLDSPKDEPLRDVEIFPDGRIEYHRTPFE